MRKYRFLRLISIFTLAVLIISLFTACTNFVSLKIKFLLNEEERVYYIGDEFDSFVEKENEKLPRIPEIYIVDSKGIISNDISHSENISFSGYDMNTEGRQTVKVKYNSEGHSAETTYQIEVKKQKILFIDASDPLHFNYGSFHVGDTFTTYKKDENGREVGVSIFLHMEDPSKPQIGYFTCDEEMKELKVDTSDCELDEFGKFTKSGIFTVHLSYNGFETDYQIKVEN